MLAAGEGETDVVVQLVKAGANLDLQTNVGCNCTVDQVYAILMEYRSF